MKRLTELCFDNAYARLPEAFYSRVTPSPLPGAALACANESAAALIDLDPAELQRPELIDYLNGRRSLPGAEPLAMVYAGHQFGGFSPRLGDGRALLLGQVRNERGQLWDLHLKGSGPTPYSRFGDGRAVLRSTIREYLASEAMAALGIPTTRALVLLRSDLPVQREQVEPGALLLRLAPSHVRFGHFEYFFHRGLHDELRILVDAVVNEHFPDWTGAADRAARLFHEACRRTGSLIARWQAVGFVHGVLNTDNMSILGLTIDYGPYAFLDAFDFKASPNHSDRSGRYAFDQQRSVGSWNLERLAQALAPLITTAEKERGLELYQQSFALEYGQQMRARLGLEQRRNADDLLVAALLDILHRREVDGTNFFRALADVDPNINPLEIAPGLDEDSDFKRWLERYRQRLRDEDRPAAERAAAMRAASPKYILRSYLAQVAIERAQKQQDFSEVKALLDLLRRPYDEQPERQAYAAPPPDWGRKLQLSCSS